MISGTIGVYTALLSTTARWVIALPPVLTGTAAVGFPLQISGNWESVQWYSDGELIEGATSETFILREEDVGKTIGVMVSGWSGSVSAATAGGVVFQFEVYVDRTGSDANDGLNAETPFATIGAAYVGSVAGDDIGLKAGQQHRRTSSASRADRGFSKYGFGDDPIFDARQHLEAVTWTLDSGTLWKTTVTHREAPICNFANSNTFSPGVWFGETFLTLKVGGADIAANKAAAAAAPGSFTIHKTGSTAQDPRSEAGGTSYDYYVNLPNGSNPNGQDVSVADYKAIAFLQGGVHRDIVFKGANGKDAFGLVSYTGAIPSFEGCSSVDFGEHGWVGPLNTKSCVFTGRGRTGVSGATLGRAQGGGVNNYTASYLPTADLTHHNLTVKNCRRAIYAHGSGNQGYRSMSLTGTLTADNCDSVLQMDVVNGTTRQAFLEGGLTCTARLSITNVDGFITGCDSVWSFTGGGSIELSEVVRVGSAQSLVEFTGTAPSCTIKDTDFSFGLTYVPNVTRYYLGYRNSTVAGHTTPVLILDNCQDVTANVNMKGKLPRVGSDSFKIHLWLKNGTTLGDLMDQATGVNYPAQLTVEAGCTFGMGDRTGPQIETALSGAGIPFTISGETTIVNRAGVTLSAPGWK